MIKTTLPVRFSINTTSKRKIRTEFKEFIFDNEQDATNARTKGTWSIHSDGNLRWIKNGQNKYSSPYPIVLGTKANIRRIDSSKMYDFRRSAFKNISVVQPLTIAPQPVVNTTQSDIKTEYRDLKGMGFSHIEIMELITTP